VSDTAGAGAGSIKPRISRWDIKKHEQHAFEQRERIPGWRLADKSRRILADVSHQLDETLPEIGAEGPDDLRPWANEFAAISAAGIAVRSGGALLAQVSCGYVIEGGASLRRVIEARLNLSALLADPSGAYGLRFLEGHPSKLATLSKRHGSRQEVAALSQLNHADSSTLDLFWDPDQERQRGAITYGKFHVYPQVVEEQALSVLYVASKEFVGIGKAVCDVFGVKLEETQWVSRELRRLDDLVEQDGVGDSA
jgi:hypothetical protein